MPDSSVIIFNIIMVSCRRHFKKRYLKSCVVVLIITFTTWTIYNKHFNTSSLKNNRNKHLTTVLPNIELLRKQDLNLKANGKLLKYHCPFAPSFTGKPFRPDDESLKSLQLPLVDNFVVLSDSVLKDFIFVTAASEQFVNGLINAIASVHKYFPDRKIIVYDLGMRRDSLKKVSRLCNVKINQFTFDQYPWHVDHLYLYSWKPILIHETLKHNSGVFWIDSSVRMTSGNMTQTFEDVKRTSGILLFRNTGHSNYAVTHGQMYHYIPSRQEEMKRTGQKEANSILIYRTRQVYTGVIVWWTLCALEQKCMCPTENRFCKFKDSMWTEYANCHRFDQSALNILLANYYNFDDTAYKSTQEILDIKRISEKKNQVNIKPKTCDAE